MGIERSKDKEVTDSEDEGAELKDVDGKESDVPNYEETDEETIPTMSGEKAGNKEDAWEQDHLEPLSSLLFCERMAAYWQALEGNESVCTCTNEVDKQHS